CSSDLPSGGHRRLCGLIGPVCCGGRSRGDGVWDGLGLTLQRNIEEAVSRYSPSLSHSLSLSSYLSLSIPASLSLYASFCQIVYFFLTQRPSDFLSLSFYLSS